MRRLLTLMFLLSPAGYGQRWSDLQTPVPLHQGDTLVIGFLGGWEHWDDEARSIRQLVQRLRREGLPGVHAETISNHRRHLALELIERALDANGDGQLDSKERSRVRILLLGHSLGGNAVVKLARELDERGIPVTLSVQIDSVGLHDDVVPGNVETAVNFYQRDGLPIIGDANVRAADPVRTHFLGNIRYSTRDQHIDMSSASWIRRTLGGPHARLEQDPRLWSQIDQLIHEAIAGSR